MQVIATAGHVDHGKSTLIRALTGTDPDRLAEEKSRGLTIDLGFAWTQLPSGAEVSFVDVPGHERFLGNMLAGIGPAPIVCFVIAADEGWKAQSTDHRDAIAALGIDQGLLVVTRTDLAPAATAATLAEARAELAGTGLAGAPAVAVSAVTGEGMEELRRLLDAAVAAARPPVLAAPVRLWVDRAFTISGAGTVVTGTLAAGRLRTGDRLDLHRLGAPHRAGTTTAPTEQVTVRGLQSRGGAVDELGPVSRAAVNLRGIDADSLGRGDLLLTPGAFPLTHRVDVRRMTGTGFEEAPAELIIHAGTAAVPARVRPLGAEHARLTLPVPLPLQVGDRLVLRGSGTRAVHCGVAVLDVDPPQLVRRGDGTRRRHALAVMPLHGDVATEVSRRGAVREQTLQSFGVQIPAPLPSSVLRRSGHLIDAEALSTWTQQLLDAVATDRASDPLGAGLPRKAAADALGLPALELLDDVVAAASLELADGRVRDPRRTDGLGTAEPAIATLENRLQQAPFAAPEADDLAALGLSPRELAAAARAGRVLRLPGEVILLPTAAALAMRELARLPQPFTLSQARQALGTTRRIAVPLLEHLDTRGWTRRVDGGHREIRR